MDLGTYPAQDQEGLPQEGSCQVATIDISWTSEWWTEPNGGWVQAPLEALFGNRALSQQGNPPHHSVATLAVCVTQPITPSLCLPTWPQVTWGHFQK